MKFKLLTEGHEMQSYKGFDLDWNDDGVDVENGMADFTVSIIDDGKTVGHGNGFRNAREYIDKNKLIARKYYDKWVIKVIDENQFYNDKYKHLVQDGFDDDEWENFDGDMVFTDNVMEAALFDSKEDAEEVAYDDGAFYAVWQEDEEPEKTLQVVKIENYLY